MAEYGRSDAVRLELPAVLVDYFSHRMEVNRCAHEKEECRCCHRMTSCREEVAVLTWNREVEDDGSDWVKVEGWCEAHWHPWRLKYLDAYWVAPEYADAIPLGPTEETT